MIDRTTKLRWRRTLRRGKRQVEDIGLQAEDNIERHFFRRVSRLVEVRRFVASWILLILILVGGVISQARSMTNYYTALGPVPGGTFTEGLVGSFTDANPLYASGQVDSSITKLLFASLLKIGQDGNLVGDLAYKWTVDSRGVQYTLFLRDKLTWHDGKPLTSDDVLFTYQTIQNPDAKSPLFNSWQGIKVTAPLPNKVVFTLPSALSSFPYSLTNGIVPKHLLKDVPVIQLRSIRFNTANPVGSGPFVWDRVEVSGNTPETREEQVGFTPFKGYYAGTPKLSSLVIRSFHDQKNMIESFKKGELDAMAGLDTMPEDLVGDANINEYNVPIAGEVAVFLKNSSQAFLDIKVRQAVVKAVDRQEVIKNLGYPVVVANSPLLKNQPGYDKNLTQLPFDANGARVLLDQSGWVVSGKDGIRMKNGQQLKFSLTAQNSPEYTKVTKLLQQQWRSVGIVVEVQLQSGVDLQGVVSRHDYDALLYGISIGPDPDVFAYWHGTQADPSARTRLNFSEYKSLQADRALEAGRSRDSALRAIKYRPFLEAWRNDAPAVVLYQPRFMYITKGELYGFNSKSLSEASDRFSDVNNWMVVQGRIPR